MTDLDLIDRKIVAELMEDATQPIARIADRAGLSQTPALRAFGLTLLFGIGLVWLISPLFRPPPHELPPA